MKSGVAERVKIKLPDMGIVGRVKGHVDALMTAAFQALLPGRMTIQYPRERRDVPDNFRGIIQFDIGKCISCFQCSFVCPANAIVMRGAPNGRFYPCIDYTKCIFCHFCVDTCPRGALIRTKVHDIAFRSMDEMFATTEEMIEPPEMIREDKAVVRYEARDGNLVMEKVKEIAELSIRPEIEVRPAKLSACAHPENCIACTLCFLTCPSNAISVKVVEGKRILEIDSKLCTGCGLCVKECPTCALVLIER